MRILPFTISFNADDQAGSSAGGGSEEKITITRAEFEKLEADSAKLTGLASASEDKSKKITELEQALTNLETERNEYKTRLEGLDSSVRKTYLEQLSTEHRKIAGLIPTIEGIAEYVKLNTKSPPAGTDSGKSGSGYKDYSTTKWDDLKYDEKEEIRAKRPEVWRKLYKEKFGQEP